MKKQVFLTLGMLMIAGFVASNLTVESNIKDHESDSWLSLTHLTAFAQHGWEYQEVVDDEDEEEGGGSNGCEPKVYTGGTNFVIYNQKNKFLIRGCKPKCGHFCEITPRGKVDLPAWPFTIK